MATSFKLRLKTLRQILVSLSVQWTEASGNIMCSQWGARDPHYVPSIVSNGFIMPSHRNLSMNDSRK